MTNMQELYAIARGVKFATGKQVLHEDGGMVRRKDMETEIKKYQDHINYLEESMSTIRSSMQRWMFELSDANETIKRKQAEIDTLRKDFDQQASSMKA